MVKAIAEICMANEVQELKTRQKGSEEDLSFGELASRGETN